jgi:hypothetical protein
MNNGFDAEKDLSQVNPQTSESELTPRQLEIYRNLKDIGPEIAAFYLDGIKILQNKELETAANLLAHVAREIDGGLRNILAERRKEELEFTIRTPDDETLTYEKEEEGTIKFDINTPGAVKLTYKKIAKHKPSILQSLGIDEPSPIAERWIEVTGKFSKFVHRHGAWKSPRSREEFEYLWYDFEEVLADLVGSYLNLLNRLDRILAYKAPTPDIIATLPNLLESDARRAYFFRELKYPTWLKPLKDAGWFDPEKNPLPYEAPDSPGYHRTPVWYALEYLEKVAHHPERPVDLLAKIVNAVVDYTNDTGERIENDGTNRRLIKIIGTFPINRIERKHIAFMSTALKYGWVSREISETILPKLLSEGKKGLSLDLLKVMFDAKVVNRQIRPAMEEYWLKEAVKKQEQAISKLCGFEAAQIALAQIRTLVDEGVHSFDFIERIEVEPSYGRRQRYAELLVSFTCRLFHLASPDSIAETVKSLLKEGSAVERNYQDAKGSSAIFGRIALNTITHHYDHLKRLFWEWEGNPLEEHELKPQLYQLIETHCLNFDESEIEQVLHWIESDQYYKVVEEQVAAVYKREWLTALMETRNEKIIAAYQKYEQINPKRIESPGLSHAIKIGYEEVNVMTVAKLSEMSNAGIAQYLNDSQEEKLWADSIHGLVKALRECVETNPRRFTDDLQPFQGVRYQYQHSILSGLRNAWRDKREFNWDALLEFIHQILSSEQFWTEPSEEPFNYRDWIISITADLIAEGTGDDKHAFDAQLLPLTEKILMALVKKAEPSVFTLEDLSSEVLDSVRGKVFSAMVQYALRYARINNPKQKIRWPRAIREDFTKRLNRSVKPSFEFSFTLGNYLLDLLDLDKEWVVGNIDRIFPQQDESHWEAAFSGYLFLPRTSEDLYFLLKKRGDYQKALNTDFADQKVLGRLIEHICWDWIEDREILNDKTSLIYQLINSGNPEPLSEVVDFFWRQQYDTPDKVKSKVKPVWRALIEVLSPNSSKAEYQEILSSLSGWLELIDKIDEETLEWLKLSAKYVERGFNSASFVEALREHVSQTPREVGEIYLETLNNKVYPDYPPTDIQEIVRILYNQGYKKEADEICNLYAKAEIDSLRPLTGFLRPLYEEYQN